MSGSVAGLNERASERVEFSRDPCTWFGRDRRLLTMLVNAMSAKPKICGGMSDSARRLVYSRILASSYLGACVRAYRHVFV